MGPKWAPNKKWVPKWDQHGPQTKNGSPNGTQMGPKQTTSTWDMHNLGMGHAQPGMGHAQPGHGTCPTSLEYGHAQPMGPNGPGPNNWARTAQGPTIGPERPRVQQMGPNGPGSAGTLQLRVLTETCLFSEESISRILEICKIYEGA